MTMEATALAKRARRTPSRRAKPHAKATKAGIKPKTKATAPRTRAQAERLVTTKSSAKTPMLSFRMDLETRELVDHAARLAGHNRTEFMIAVLREKAIEVILNQRLFVLNDSDWSAFAAELDEPPVSNGKLKALLARVPVWDQ